MRIDGAVLARWRSLDAATAVAAIADHAKRDQTFKPVKDATTSRWHVTVDGNEFELLLLGLRGTACLDMDEAPAAKQQILVSRSFGKGVTDVAGIVEAVQGRRRSCGFWTARPVRSTCSSRPAPTA